MPPVSPPPATPTLSATVPPAIDPTPLFEHFRGSYGSELLTAAVAHFRVIERLTAAPRTFDELRRDLGLAERPAHVLVTALRAFGLLQRAADGVLSPTPLAAEHLVPGAAFDVSDYIGLAADAPGVKAMVERLLANKPASTKPGEAGAAFIYREGLASAMERPDSARHFTLALAGRAKNVAPLLAARVSLAGARTLVDVGGGTGIYSIAWLQRHPDLRAIVWDRPEVLQVTAEMAAAYGVADRLETRAGDMFADPVPTEADVILLSNVLHDWDVPECQALVQRCVAALPIGGQLVVHDVFVADSLDGPLPLALYSAALFTLTEGRAYSAAECRGWMEQAGLTTAPLIPTLVHCAALVGRK